VRMYRAYARSGADPLVVEGHDENVADAVSAETEGARLAGALALLQPQDGRATRLRPEDLPLPRFARPPR
jgi:hypothetical protein